MSELLGALGLAWPRLLIYPGGLVALLGAWLIDRWWRFSARSPTLPLPALRLVDLLPPLVALSLLPLPPARSFPYGLDLPTALCLIEWPYWRTLARTGGLAPSALRASMPAYAMVLIAACAWATATGSLEAAALTRRPADALGWVLMGVGTLLWLAVLPALHVPAPTPLWPLRVRGLALLALPALVVIGMLAALLTSWVPASVLAWLLPPIAVIVCALVVTGFSRLPEHWLRRIWWVLGGLIGGLVVLAGL